MPEILDYADAHTDEILGTLSQMVGQESFTSDKTGTDILGSYIRGRLESMGAVVQSVPQSTARKKVADLSHHTFNLNGKYGIRPSASPQESFW